MTTYNPAEVERLLVGIKPHVEVLSADVIRTGPLEKAIHWLHANLAVLANQLEVARTEIDAKDASIAALEEIYATQSSMNVEALRERDAAHTEADRLRASVSSLCNADAASQAGRAEAEQRCRTMGEITDEALGLLFGLLTSTGPDRMSINDRRVLIQVAERLQRVQREMSK